MESNNKNCQESLTSKLPEQTDKDTVSEAKKKKVDPTRFGDWEINGRCIDF